LQEWCRLQRTTLVLGVFTAYVALVFRWCGVSDMVVHYQIDGRMTPGMQNTVGYFSSPLFLRIELRDQDNFVDLLNRLTQEYCNAFEHADASYIESRIPRPDFARNTGFNWIPRDEGLALSELEGSENALTCAPLPFPHPMMKTLQRDYEPAMVLFDADQGIHGDLYFPLRYSHDHMDRLARHFYLFLAMLLKEPGMRLRDVVLEACLPEVQPAI
jgi:non-ribosomal peptide synthetase component F